MKYLAAAVVLALAALIGHMDYEDAVLEERAYCMDVRDRMIPNYNHLDCKAILAQSPTN